MDLSNNRFDFLKLLSLNLIYFQEHLYISSIDFSCILIILYRNGIHLNKAIKIQKLIYLFTFDYFYFYYIIFLVKSSYSIASVYLLLFTMLLLIILFYFIYCMSSNFGSCIIYYITM